MYDNLPIHNNKCLFVEKANIRQRVKSQSVFNENVWLDTKKVHLLKRETFMSDSHKGDRSIVYQKCFFFFFFLKYIFEAILYP